MLMNLGVGDNGVRILKEETVKSILAKSTRPAGMGGYSLGLGTSEDGWFGHGGAWGTNCQVNWKTKQLKLHVVQLCGMPRPWSAASAEAEKAFFKAVVNNRAAGEYTGRMK
jgi:CubicO group peptidase (beta-lactamase class C family)